jgi:hypothetical protein
LISSSCCGVISLQVRGNAKIAKQRMIRAIKKDVSWGEVAMEDVTAVAVIQADERLANPPHG